MLRVSLCAVFVAVAFGLGVDDTEKRRSEEILRAVAAAATADYEGLQQMKFQKATTAGKITSTTSTASCVDALKTALETEKLELQTSSGEQTDDMNGDASVDGSQDDITAKKAALQKALHKALETTYMSIHNEYKRVKEHAQAMMTALQNELSDRNCDDDPTTECHKFQNPVCTGTTTNQGSCDGATGNSQVECEQTTGATWSDPPTCDTYNNQDDCVGAGCDVSAHVIDSGESIFKAIVAATTKQLSPTDQAAFDNDGFSTAVMDILQDLLLANANEEAYQRLTSEEDAEKSVVEDDLIKLASILAGPENDDHGYGVQNHNSATVGVDYNDMSAQGEQTGTDAGHERIETHAEAPGAISFERYQLRTIETAFVDYVRSKSLYHNTSTKKTALEAAVAMVDAKISAVQSAKTKITSYSTELQGLEDDEMRKIHDIKEEFESLAADWLQLATYHCCDIVQGNAIECDDATAHLIAPINTVFPNALRKPNVQTDCTRRLL